jgi:hypothetical protein
MNILDFLASLEPPVPANTYRGIIMQGNDEDGMTVEWHGETCDFNTVQDAKDWIDEEMDTDFDHDPIREWGTLGR